MEYSYDLNTYLVAVWKTERLNRGSDIVSAVPKIVTTVTSEGVGAYLSQIARSFLFQRNRT